MDDPVDDVDLEACAREPLHVPGAVQSRGVLLVVDDGVVVQASANAPGLLGLDLPDLLGHRLDATLGGPAAGLLRLARVPEPVPLAEALRRVTFAGRSWTAASHRTGQGTVVVELEPRDDASDPGDGYRTAYAVLGRAATAGSLQELYDLVARGVREVTGFDRVMVYRFDADQHGEVVAEDCREDLEPLLGQHYPASDIPPQARALYEKSWLRLISDVSSEPVALVPVRHPATGQPADLTFAGLRAVSPVHVQYLKNMGVGASMSISLLDDGHLWGMVACHHETPHTPSLEVCAAAEALASGLSLQMVVHAAADRAQHARRVATALEALVAAGDGPVAEMVARPELLDVLGVDGALVRTRGITATVGTVPPAAGAVVAAVRAASAPRQEDGGGAPVFATHALRADHPELAERLGDVGGALVAPLPDGDVLALFRREAARAVTWGGDPRAKTVERDDDGTTRIGPRRSFASWREIVHGTSEPWSDDDVRSAVVARRTVVEALYRRTRPDLGAALVLQHSSLPDTLPAPPGWRLQARYRPARGGSVGGDWYDAFDMPDGRVALVIGDVAGHGLPAASAMNQLRNALRSLLLTHGEVGRAVGALDHLARTLLSGDMATVFAALLEPGARTVDYVCAGHLPPLVVDEAGAQWLDVVRSLPVGAMHRPPEAGRAELGEGQSLLLYTDGLVERRGTSLESRLEELRAMAGLTLDLEVLEHKLAGVESEDDSTTLLVTAHGRAWG
ncbi:GAF domain-containing SpoIIE family protein phosphatase [Promicromonospora sp. Marseille-Q5078]